MAAGNPIVRLFEFLRAHGVDCEKDDIFDPSIEMHFKISDTHTHIKIILPNQRFELSLDEYSEFSELIVETAEYSSRVKEACIKHARMLCEDRKRKMKKTIAELEETARELKEDDPFRAEIFATLARIQTGH